MGEHTEDREVFADVPLGALASHGEKEKLQWANISDQKPSEDMEVLADVPLGALASHSDLPGEIDVDAYVCTTRLGWLRDALWRDGSENDQDVATAVLQAVEDVWNG